MRSSLGLAVVLAFAMATTPVAVQAAPSPTQPLVNVTGIQIHSIGLEGNQLVANSTVTFDIGTRSVQEDVLIPITMSARLVPGSCSVLDLRLGPIYLNLLGLVINLDDCAGHPVVVSITAQRGTLLGNLLCNLGSVLSGNGSNLGDVLGLLNQGDLALLETGLTSLLNSFFSNFLTGAGPTPLTDAAADQLCQILHLAIPGGIHLYLELLGLRVDTSAICLTVSAQKGGNLLGNLLCSLTHITNDQTTAKNQQAMLNSIYRLLDRLGL